MVKNKDSYCLFSFATELVGLISAAPPRSSGPEKRMSVRGRNTGSFPDQQLVIKLLKWLLSVLSFTYSTGTRHEKKKTPLIICLYIKLAKLFQTLTVLRRHLRHHSKTS